MDEKKQINTPTCTNLHQPCTNLTPTYTNSAVGKLKQIEEMAKDLTNYERKLCERLPKDKCLLTSAIHAQVSCDYCKIAEFLYNKGYRKQSEGEWIEDTEYYDDDYSECNVRKVFVCSKCGRTEKRKEPYCNCGAKMKGGAE